MTRDEIVTAAVVVAFATLVTTHATLVAALAARPPRWRAAAALVVAPLAPFWGWHASRKRAIVWIASAVVYAGLLWVARR
jgi:hypothetical protein